MNLTEDEITKKYANQYMHSTCKTLLPYENESTSFRWGYNVTKQKTELTKIQRKNNFVNRLENAEKKKSVCINV